tara:strand:+ start:3128 stop:3760 length:633 start_codon:yes stop_codon:yes gene_type:complete
MFMNKLVTFGDSFVEQSVHIEPLTWLDYVCQENDLILDSRGVGGIGPWSTIMNFLDYDKDFDICFFAWSTLHREMDIKKDSNDYIFLKGIALLQWFDRFLQKNYSDKKIIHLYSFKESDYISDDGSGHEVNILNKNNIHFDFYPHIFEQGINIKPELLEFSKLLDFNFTKDIRSLHMAPQVHESFAKQLNKVLKDESLNNGDVVEFNLEY